MRRLSLPERRRPRHPHTSQGGVREAAVKQPQTPSRHLVLPPRYWAIFAVAPGCPVPLYVFNERSPGAEISNAVLSGTLLRGKTGLVRLTFHRVLASSASAQEHATASPKQTNSRDVPQQRRELWCGQNEEFAEFPTDFASRSSGQFPHSGCKFVLLNAPTGRVG